MLSEIIPFLHFLHGSCFSVLESSFLSSVLNGDLKWVLHNIPFRLLLVSEYLEPENHFRLQGIGAVWASLRTYEGILIHWSSCVMLTYSQLTQPTLFHKRISHIWYFFAASLIPYIPLLCFYLFPPHPFRSHSSFDFYQTI